MIRVIGFFAAVLIALAGVVVGVNALVADPDAPTPDVAVAPARATDRIPTAPPARSRVEFDTDAEGYTITRYEVAADEALVLRFADAGMDSCDFNVHRGPDSSTWRTPPDVTVDFEFVPRDRWEATVKRMGRPCGDYWVTS